MCIITLLMLCHFKPILELVVMAKTFNNFPLNSNETKEKSSSNILSIMLWECLTIKNLRNRLSCRPD